MNPLTFDPISALLALLPPTTRTLVSCALSLIVLASAIVGSTNKRDAPWAKALRIVSAVVHSDEPGTLKIPFTTWVLGASEASVVHDPLGLLANPRPLTTPETIQPITASHKMVVPVNENKDSPGASKV